MKAEEPSSRRDEEEDIEIEIDLMAQEVAAESLPAYQEYLKEHHQEEEL